MNKPLIRIVISLCSSILIHNAAADTAMIATASNFSPTMKQLIDVFHQQHPHQLRQTNASSGVLFSQVQHGAPFDVFFSADQRYPATLESLGLAAKGSRFTYAQGQLVLVANQPFPDFTTTERRPITERLSVALASGAKIAIANPDIAPYGIAAQQLLERLNLWYRYPKQLIRGHNVGQALLFVASGNADYGFVARSQLALDHSLHYLPLPDNSHQPILQQAILLQSAANNPAASAFIDFVKSKQAKAIIRQHGYLTP